MATDNFNSILENNKKKLGDLIKERREELGFTQEQVAVGAKISQPSVADIEKGTTKPRKPTIEAIGKFLRCDFGLDWLKIALSENKNISLEETFREIIREIVREEIAKERRHLVLPIGNPADKQKDKAA